MTRSIGVNICIDLFFDLKFKIDYSYDSYYFYSRFKLFNAIALSSLTFT